MKQWIREHPWRLEIAPFLIFTAAIIGSVLVPEKAHELGCPGWHVEERSWLDSAAEILILSFIFMTQSQRNHQWVLCERSKRFNYHVIIWNPFMVAYGFIRLIPGSGSVPSSNETIVWFATGVTLLALGILLELTRPFAPRQSVPPITQKTIEIGDATHFYYRQRITHLYFMLPWYIFGFAVALTHSETWQILAIILALLMIAVYTGSQSSFSVTKEKLVVRSGFGIQTLPICDVTACQVQELQPGQPTEWNDAIGSRRRLWVWTSDGKAHAIPATNPEEACDVINAILDLHLSSTES